MVHVDINKVGRIPDDGGGWRARVWTSGRQRAESLQVWNVHYNYRLIVRILPSETGRS